MITIDRVGTLTIHLSRRIWLLHRTSWRSKCRRELLCKGRTPRSVTRKIKRSRALVKAMNPLRRQTRRFSSFSQAKRNLTTRLLKSHSISNYQSPRLKLRRKNLEDRWSRKRSRLSRWRRVRVSMPSAMNLWCWSLWSWTRTRYTSRWTPNSTANCNILWKSCQRSQVSLRSLFSRRSLSTCRCSCNYMASSASSKLKKTYWCRL